VRGEFEAGDAVDIAEPQALDDGQGICNYSAAELRRAPGCSRRGVRFCLRQREPSTGTGSSWRRRG
jgi:glutamate 5-kinase